jgi:tryprostatin B 6-hydroxylase
MHPQQASKLYEEVSVVPHTDRKALQQCKYLDAFLMEVLRLHPVVLTGGLRDTPRQGMTIGEEIIPGNITVQVPRFSIARCEFCQSFISITGPTY